MICQHCGRDLDKIGHDNISPYPNYPLCEDCGKDKNVLEDARLDYQARQNSDAIWRGFYGSRY